MEHDALGALANCLTRDFCSHTACWAIVDVFFSTTVGLILVGHIFAISGNSYMTNCRILEGSILENVDQWRQFSKQPELRSSCENPMTNTLPRRLTQQWRSVGNGA